MDETRHKKIITLLNHPNIQIDDVSPDGMRLYDQSLTHSSYAREQHNKNLPYADNERLEFLGNFVLGLVISEYLYSEFDYSEGDMTKRMAIVSDANLAEIIRKKKLHINDGFILMGDRRVSKSDSLEDSILAGWFEAFIGAVYLDQGLAKSKEIILGLMANEITQFDPDRNYIGRLQEYIQQNKLGELQYYEQKVMGPDHKPTFKAHVKISGKKFGKGLGKSKKLARMEAAKMALKQLEITSKDNNTRTL